MSAFLIDGELTGFGHCKVVASVLRFVRFIPIRPRGLALSGLVEVWCSIVQNVLSVLSRHALRPVLSTI